MEQINDLNEAYLFLNEKGVLVSVFGQRKSYFALKKEAIFVSNEQLNCYITFEQFEDLFGKQKFYLYEDDKDEFVSMEKDREYYSIKHK